MNPLIDVALQVLPEVVRYLGRGGKGKTADAVAQAVQDVTRTSDPRKAADTVAKDPQLASALRMRLAGIAASAEADMRQGDLQALADSVGGGTLAPGASPAPAAPDAPAADAPQDPAEEDMPVREFARSLTKAAGPMIWGSLGISVIVAVSFIAILALIVLKPDRFSDLQQNQVAFQLVNITIGALTAAFATVVSFWLGSSQGSRNKDSAQLTMQVAQSEQTRDLVKAQSAQAARLTALHQQPQPAVAAAVSAPAPSHAAPSAAAPAPVTSAGARFNACVEVVLQKEGGYVDNPADPGGATNMGITLKTLEEWRGHPVTAQDVETLTEAEAKQIYYANYWNALRCDDLRAGIDLAVFDFGVNAGIGRAAKTLQTCVGAADDGVIGPITVAACQKFTAQDVIETYSQKRLKYYQALPDFGTFGKDWTDRVKSIETVALGMAKQA